MKVICISGKARHGKDTAAVFMKNYLEEKHKRVLIVHYGDLVKHVCRTFFDWNGKKDNAGRSLLQFVGTDAIRKKQPNYWVQFICDMLEFFENEWDYVLIPDCRFPNEYEELKQKGFDTYLIRIIRDNYDNELSPKQQEHVSETALDQYSFDYVIHNRDLNDFIEEVVEIMCKIQEEYDEVK